MSQRPFSPRSRGSSLRDRPRINRPRCAQCGTRRFRKDHDTGQLICREGHILQGYREEEVQDDGEFVNTHSQRRYTRKDPSISAREKRRKKEQAERQVWGASSSTFGKETKARASFQCYECLQLILRLQLKALRLEWPDLPPEIEAIARDLWTMFVSLNADLQPSPYAENLDFAREQLQTAREESDARSERRSRSRSRARMEEEKDRARRGGTNDREEHEAEAELFDKMDEEIRRVEQDSSNDDEYDKQDGSNIKSVSEGPHSENTSDRAARPSSRSENAFTKERKRMVSMDPMNVLICIIYLSLITARVPILWGDIHRLLSSNRIPYLSVTQLLPGSMIAKLPENELRKIEMESVPNIITLQERTSRLAADLTARFPSANVQFPELNAAPVVWRLIKDMGLPPTFYEPTRSLLTYLSIPLAVVPDLSVSDPWSLLGGVQENANGESVSTSWALPPMGGRMRNNMTPPHATRCSVILAAIIILAKMRFGLDDKLRINHSIDPPIDVPCLDRWLNALAVYEKGIRSHPFFSHQLQTHPSYLTGDQIDSLLDHCEETYFEREQPNLRHVHRKADLVGGSLFPNLPDPKVHRCVRPYTEFPDSAMELGDRGLTSERKMLEILEELRQDMHSQLYPLPQEDFDEETDMLGSGKKGASSLRPGDAYTILDIDDHDVEPHPSYQRVLKHAAVVIGLTNDTEDGWRQMGRIVYDMENLLLRRMRREALIKGGRSSGTFAQHPS
ncbi:unnamed protein product [Sympodiomycopsis kandeliae]